MTSLGNREEGGGDDPSQETCPNVESQTCGPRVYVLTNVFSNHTTRVGESIGGGATAEMRSFFAMICPEQIHRKR